jgi:WD40 repeat protein
MAQDVFISYSNKDKAIADGICANLEAAGARCWIAPRDIAPGEDWPAAINQAITKSRIMVLVFSHNSNSSEDVSRELILAANSKLVIIPFKIDNVEPEPGKQYYLARTHWLDAMNPPTREQIGILVETVTKLLTPRKPIETPKKPGIPPKVDQGTKQEKTKRFKPWMLWIAIPSLFLLIMAIGAGGVYLGSKLLKAKINTATPTSEAAVPALTKPFTPMPGTTNTTEASPATGSSVNVHATAGTILDEQGSYIAWSSDGNWLIIGGREIHYYDPQSLKIMHSFQADRWVTGMAISPDSKILAAIDETRGVMLFETATGSELLSLPRTTISTSTASSSFLAFSPDSTTLAVVLGDTVKLFNIASGQETGTIVSKGTQSILFSPDGQSLYAGGWNGINVWNLASGALIHSMGDSSNEGNCLALSPDGSLLASAGSFDKPIVLWEAATGHQLRTFSGHTGGINRLVFSPDGKLLASSAGDVTIKLWDVASGNALQTLVGHTQAASSLAFSPDGATLVSGSQDGTTRLWNLSTGGIEPTATTTKAPSAVNPPPTALPLSAQAITVDNAIQVKNLDILDVEGIYVAWSPDGKWLVVGRQEIHFYDAQSMSRVRTVQVKYDVGGLAISPDSKVLAVIDISNAVKLFDLASGSELQTLPRTAISTGGASSSFLAFSPDSTTLAVVLGDTVKLFNVASGQETGTIVSKGTQSILFSPDGQSLYAGGWNGINVWNLASGALIRSMGNSSNEGNCLALSPDGSLLASAGSFDKPIVLWEAATGLQLRTFSGHTGGINRLVFSPDGKLLASSAGDVTIKLWDVASGNALQTLVGHTQAASSLTFSPDGATLASIGYDQGVWLWGVSTE